MYDFEKKCVTIINNDILQLTSCVTDHGFAIDNYLLIISERIKQELDNQCTVRICIDYIRV